MEIATDQFRAVAAAAQIGTAQVRSAYATGYWAGRRHARRRYLPLILLLLVHLSALRMDVITRLTQPVYNLGFADGRHAATAKPQPAPRPRLRLISGGGRHAERH